MTTCTKTWEQIRDHMADNQRHYNEITRDTLLTASRAVSPFEAILHVVAETACRYKSESEKRMIAGNLANLAVNVWDWIEDEKN